MTFFEAILSGVIQGLTEFLPISSSGHLVILHTLFGFKEPQILFDIFLHLGTLFAIIIVFFRDIVESIVYKKALWGLIIVASVVTAAFVLIFARDIEPAFANVRFVGGMLIVTGVWLISGNFLRFGTEGMSTLKAVLIGLAQGIASIPGISRSGATISTGVFLGIEPVKAARFSFLLSIPAIIGAFLFKIKGVSFSALNLNYLVGLVTSCIVGIFSLKLLLKILYHGRFHLFGLYCILVGLLVLLFL